VTAAARTPATSTFDHPLATTPTIQPGRVVDAHAPIAPFRDDVWPLAALGRGPSVQPRSLNFEGIPAGFREAAKHFAWLIINEPTPESYLQRGGGKPATWLAPGTIHIFLAYFRTIAECASALPTISGATHVLSPSDLDPARLLEISTALDEDHTLGRTSRDGCKALLVRLPHHNDRLPPAYRWPPAPWENTAWRTPPAGGANLTPRIPQVVMAPLLEWALAVVNAADDIFAGWDEYLRLEAVAASAKRNHGDAAAALRTYEETGLALPANAVQGEIRLASRLLAGRHGVHAQTLTIERREHFSHLPLDASPHACRLNVPITAKVRGKPWISELSYFDFAVKGGIAPLLRVLRTASLVSVAYLTGMRPQELLALEAGCAPEPSLLESGRQLFLVHGHAYKGRRGSQALDGAVPSWEGEAAAWATIPEGRLAALTAERITSHLAIATSLLFPRFQRPDHALTSTDVRADIDDFVNFVNERLAVGANPTSTRIPEGGLGLSLSQFRRTLAWFIRNQPHGNVTLALQYQHLSMVIGDGYASTADSGFPDLLIEEGWENRKSVIAHLAASFAAGEGISGPGAERIVAAVTSMPQVIAEKDERRLRKDPRFTIYANPYECSYCAADPDVMPCSENPARTKAAMPNLAGCRGQVCPNFASTDQNARDLADRAAQMRSRAKRATRTQGPSLLAKAATLDDAVRRHERDRIVLPSPPGGDPR